LSRNAKMQNPNGLFRSGFAFLRLNFFDHTKFSVKRS